MFHLRNTIAFILLSISICQAKTGGHRASGTTTSKVTVQPWFIGLAAVVGFLFIVFVLLIAKRLFSKKEKDEREEKKTEDVNFYENLEADEETKQTNF
ncbi:small integral membrane protein 24 [Paramisgurnus dabryanus]|uniref:small integral membrane protein 24 n=1 Tax=Paramisgurnus dabryanus TaxID=90735 RepID=UPI0031F4775C